jgi:hypothetical protein
MLDTKDGTKRWFLAMLVALVWWVRPAEALADCAAKAKAQLDSFKNVTVERATLDGKEVASAACSSGETCRIVFFSTKKNAAAPAAPAGYTAPEKRWAPVASTASGADCAELFEYVFEKRPSEDGEKPKPGPGATSRPFEESKVALGKASSAEEALAAFKKAPRSYTALAAGGTAQFSINDAAAEALQILGQIVVDRASAKGYGLIQERLKRALNCTPPAKPDESTAGAGEAKTRFPSTCAVLDTLRLQDIAMAPQALANALSVDLLNILKTEGPKTASARNPAMVPAAGGPSATPAGVVGVASSLPDRALLEALHALALSLFTKVGQPQDLAVQRALAALTDYVSQQSDVKNLSAVKKAAVFGVLSFARCAGKNQESAALAQCNIAEELESLGVPSEVRASASDLGQRLVAIVSAAKNTRSRVQLAIDTVADTACMIVRNEESPTLGCPLLEEVTTLDELSKIAFAQAFVDATLTKDAMRFTVVAAKLVDIVWANAAEEKYDKRSALRMLAALLDYAATYAPDPNGNADDQLAASRHEQRTKILESLTEDMSDRTGREGDDVFSLGGALRLYGGIRIGTQTKATRFQGPISLPLGVAYTHVPKRENAWGFHVQLNAVDLGNYLALQEGPEVKKPELGDAFAPGISIGAGYGPTLPFVLTVDASYTPQYKIDPDKPDERGSFNVGLAMGVHVPLLDLN